MLIDVTDNITIVYTSHPSVPSIQGKKYDYTYTTR